MCRAILCFAFSSGMSQRLDDGWEWWLQLKQQPGAILRLRPCRLRCSGRHEGANLDWAAFYPE